MKVFCSLWRCLGSGEADVDASYGNTQSEAKAQLAQNKAELDEIQSSKLRHPIAREGRDSASFNRAKEEHPAKESGPDRVCSSGPGKELHHVQALSLPLNERTLRALLQKAKATILQQDQSLQHPHCLPKGAVGIRELLTNPDLGSSNAQLLEACSTPRPDTRVLLRVELLLGDLRRWLAVRPHPAAATVLLYNAGDGLAHAEHCIRSVGQVRFWQPDVVSAFLALLQLYGDLLLQASSFADRHGRKPTQKEQQQPQEQEGQPLRQSVELQPGSAAGSIAPPCTKDGGWRRMLTRDGMHPGEGRGLGSPQAAPAGRQARDDTRPLEQQQEQREQERQEGRHGRQQHPLSFAVAALLLRPEWLDLLAELLELLHFSTEYADSAARAGRPAHEALSSALQLWAFLTQLAKFAASHADSVQRMAACLQRLGALLAPPSGVVPRLLARPLREDTLAAQLHALWLLQVLYDMPDAKVLYHPGVADHYVALHHAAMVEFYEASAADPNSAVAELCRIHATLLRSLARQPGQPVRAAFARARTAEWLLAEISLESQLLPCAQQAEENEGVAEEEGASTDESGDASSVKEAEQYTDGDQDAPAAHAASDGRGCSSSSAGSASSDCAPACEGVAPEPLVDAARKGHGEGGDGKGFAFTYDLNEDVERLMALEDKLGHALEVDGFEYDEEGRQLMARSDARQAEATAFAAAVTAAAEAAAAASEAAQEQDGDHGRTGLRVRLQGESEDGGEEALSLGPTSSGSANGNGSGGGGTESGSGGNGFGRNGRSVSRRSSNVPRLTLAGLRAASISSMAVRSIRSSSAGVRRLGNAASRASAANSAWGTVTSFGGENETDAGEPETEAGGASTEGDDDEQLSEGATTPGLDPAAAAERVAHWSTSFSGMCNDGVDDASSPSHHGSVALTGDAAPCLPRLRSRGTSSASVAAGALDRSLRVVDAGFEEPGSPTAPSPTHVGARELTCSNTIHTGPQGELHMMVPASAAASARSTGPTHGSLAPGLGKPPLPGPRPVIPPLRMGTGNTAVDGGAGQPSALPPMSASARASAPPMVSSRAMVLLSASNRASAGVWASVLGNGQAQPQLQAPSRPSRSSSGTPMPPGALDAPSTPVASSPFVYPQPQPQSARPGGGPHSPPLQTAPLPALPPQEQQQSLLSVSAPQVPGEVGVTSSPEPTARPRQPLIPVLNLASLRRGGAGPSSRGTATDTGRTAALSVMLRATTSNNASSLPGGSAMDSCASPPTAKGNRATGTSVASVATASPPDAPPPGAPPSNRFASSSGGRTDRPAASDIAPLERIPEAGQPAEQGQPAPPDEAATYEELACRRLLYQDPKTHLLLLKILFDLLVSPSGSLDSANLPQRPADSGAPHAEYILLWHLNAPRNGGVVYELCRRAQQRAALAAARATELPVLLMAGTGAAALAPTATAFQQAPRRTGTGGCSAPDDSARDYQGPPQSSACSQHAATPLPPNTPPAGALATGGAAPAPAPSARPAAVMRALRLLSRPLFDAECYTNLQFVARGAYGGIYRARMEPRLVRAPSAGQPDRLPSGSAVMQHPAQVAAGAVQVVIKTIPLPSSPFDSCVLADVYGEVSIMERFTGYECICQLLDYGMHDDAYWIVMRRYRCSLAEWRARQRPLGDAAVPPSAAPPAVKAAACVYLSALTQVVDALRLLAAHNVVHFDLKCSNVLIEPLPGISDGDLWAPVGGISTSMAGGSISGAAAAPAPAAGDGGGEVHAVPFRCVLADFGEARAYRSAAEAFTARNRGTEVFKSPEMLLLDAGGRAASDAAAAPASSLPHSASLQFAPSAGRRPLSPANRLPSSSVFGPATAQPGRGPSRPTSATAAGQPGRAPSRPASAAAAIKPQRRQVLAGAGLASDIWSLGCLAYELLSGTVLFAGDYASVTHRVAFGTGERLTLTEPERARLGRLPQLVGLVEWILARDPAKRPSLDQIRARIQQARADLAGS